ncbi:ABC transporter ATP-binding protein [Picosynechococcus sp. PCC 11901]|uniref:ABC transporter ATP-binding protein n=1 Tax=Picosynechococcus sp. PCC 11901 TaxID=2579791 RepID=UPI0010FBD7CE|nr:ABC transporter ATP-binding protein [Picosynechococcus sp. PCC 11901]QCS50700.1 ABC transporter ATP-binding protein [Picosynechococcus sp. PCC 11901]
MIEVEQLGKTYGQTEAIADLSFRVETGEIVGFLGPNGAGKTTTLRILSAYLPATTGTAKIAGYDVHTESMTVRRHLGYLPENPPLYPNMTVAGYLNFVAQLKGVNAGDRPHKIQAALAQCQLQTKANNHIRNLSKGYRQRVGIAQAIVHDPPVIILDEPTVGLDPAQMIEVRHLIKSLGGDRTILLSTHLLSEVSLTCDRVVMINQGHLVATDTPHNLQNHFLNYHGYELETDGELAQIQRLLDPLPGVIHIESLAPMNPRRPRLRITTADNPEWGKDIARILVNAGVGLYEMQRLRPSLEDVFLELLDAEANDPMSEQLHADAE